MITFFIKLDFFVSNLNRWVSLLMRYEGRPGVETQAIRWSGYQPIKKVKRL